jgi:hypothetical protein
LLSAFAVDVPTGTLIFATWSITSLADFSVSFSPIHCCTYAMTRNILPDFSTPISQCSSKCC